MLDTFSEYFDKLPKEKLNEMAESCQDLEYIRNYDIVPKLDTIPENERLKLIIKFLEAKNKLLEEFFDSFYLLETMMSVDEEDDDDEDLYDELRDSLKNTWLMYGDWNEDYKKYIP